MDLTEIDLYTLKKIAEKHGLLLVSCTSAESLEAEKSRLVKWQAAGMAGDMKYMNRSPDLLCEPRQLLPTAKSIVVFAVAYSARPRRALPIGHGRVARYAWGTDYHSVLKERLVALFLELEQLKGSFSFRLFSDAVPLLERAIAARAKLGFIGKNTLLIRPGIGSFFFIAEALVSFRVLDLIQPTNVGTCGSCKRCLSSCPTDAIVEPYVLDARRCISYLTIEKRGLLNQQERLALGDWVFGCDVCQEVCPFNHRSLSDERIAAFSEFEGPYGVGEAVELKSVLSIRTKLEFDRVFNSSAISRTGRVGLLRNSACVAANTMAECCLAVMIDSIQQDCSDVVRLHCLIAVISIERQVRSGISETTTALINRLKSDPSALVQRERLNILRDL